jgi:ribosomal protein S18 acetylase RimI-like enzyme
MIRITQLTEADFDHVSPRLDDWWGGRSMSAMLPRLWFKHFSETCFASRDDEGRPVGFLVGYVHNNDQEKAYVHFIGVDPVHRGRGLGRLLHHHFEEKVVSIGCSTIEAVTSPSNLNSLAFHEALGFVAVEPDGSIALPSEAQGVKDYDGVGENRIMLRKSLSGS